MNSPKPAPTMGTHETLTRELAEALAHYIPNCTVGEFVERNEKARCHIGLTDVYGCGRCSKIINAIRTLSMARAAGFIE